MESHRSLRGESRSRRTRRSVDPNEDTLAANRRVPNVDSSGLLGLQQSVGNRLVSRGMQRSGAPTPQAANPIFRILGTADILGLQQTVGNRAVSRLIASHKAAPMTLPIQRRDLGSRTVKSGALEAERTAEQVTSGVVPAGPLDQRQAGEDAGSRMKPGAADISQLQRKNEENEDESNRAIHRATALDELQAQADLAEPSYAGAGSITGQDACFGQGGYQPSSPGRQHLLAHPLQRTDAPQTKHVFGETAPLSAVRRGERDAQIQRYSTSAGFLSNKVEFELQNYAATLAAPLKIKKKANLLKISSQDYRANGTVKASGPQDRVGQFQLGMLQTVYDSRRSFYYEPDAYSPGILQQIGTALAPGLVGDRVKVTDMCKPLPVRDGDNGVVPWYEIKDVADFDIAADSTKTTQIYDQPGTAMEWTQNVNGEDQHLVKTRGQDSFRTWVSVQEKGTTGFMGMHRLAYIDWKVDYGTDITYDPANPTNSVVTPTGDSGGKITQISDGFGAFIPLMGDPVANDAATEETEKW